MVYAGCIRRSMLAKLSEQGTQSILIDIIRKRVCD